VGNNESTDNGATSLVSSFLFVVLAETDSLDVGYLPWLQRSRSYGFEQHPCRLSTKIYPRQESQKDHRWQVAPSTLQYLTLMTKYALGKALIPGTNDTFVYLHGGSLKPGTK
jgi:hypothetical protein